MTSGLSPSWTRLYLRFGRARLLPELGARSRTASIFDGTTLTVVVAEGTGRAARWLAEGGPRWLGFTVSVRDLHDTARWLAHSGVAYEHIDINGMACLLAEPDGGAIVLFHPAKGARGFRPS